MSHSKEREEKICLNCNTELNGRFCHRCGQENLEPQESVWSLVSHFFYDITHFDGKFFGTLGYLIRRPGFLPKEYLRGRRASYLNPVRMYVFSSALFFIIFFSMYDVREWDLGEVRGVDQSDSVATREGLRALNDARSLVDSITEKGNYYDSQKKYRFDQNVGDSTEKPASGWTVNYKDVFSTKGAYDSAERAKPASERDDWLSRKLNYRIIELKNKYEGKEDVFLKDWLDKFIHTLPYLLFVSLPLYALFLRLLYIRRKQFFYVSHGIFLIHLYIFTFIVLLIFFALSKLSANEGWGWVGFLQGALLIYGVWYTLKAMRNFYGQGWGKTISKFILLNFLALISLIFLFSVFFLFAAFRI